METSIKEANDQKLEEENQKEVIKEEKDMNKSRNTENIFANLEKDSTRDYEIYPQVKEISYSGGTVDISEGLSLNLNEDLDKYTVDKAHTILEKNEITLLDYENSPKLVVTTTDETDDFYQNYDAYKLVIADDTITITGRDTDAAFYGIETLDLILQQANGEVRNLEIADYSSTKYRGAIEGYYGNPWGWENRIENLEFGGQFKSNIFVFAPKDDPYHNSQWRDLYPEEAIAEIARVAEAGNQNKNRFVWTIHPFMNNPLTSETIDEDLPILISKFEQLYDAGVRQFGVLADDTGGIDKDAIVKVVNELSKWGDEKGDVYDLLFCPNSYTLSWNWDGEELTKFDKEFPENVQIFFTGKNTMSAVNERDLTIFKTKDMPDGEVRRNPLFWLNWPVNDIDNPGEYRRIFIGPMYMAENDVESLVGVVTNPMEHAELSKLAIFTLSDYAWNIRDFDAEKSWNDAFKYFETEAAEELKAFALNNTDSENRGYSQPESEDFDLPTFEYEMAINTEDMDKYKEKADNLQKLYQDLHDVTAAYVDKGSNDYLKAELEPYTGSMQYTALAGVKYIDAITEYKKNGASNEFRKHRDEADETWKKANSFTYNSLGTEYPTMTGTKRIRPNIEKLAAVVKGMK